MEKIEPGIFWKIAMMRKDFGIAASLILVIASANAQTQKKEPPPPPPPKSTTIIDEKCKVEGPPVITVKGKMADEFYKRNPSVSEIARQGSIITLKKKDGTEEKYNTSKKEEDKSFTDQYGVSPIPPPPPPKRKSKA